jgi:hypothetical protein
MQTFHYQLLSNKTGEEDLDSRRSFSSRCQAAPRRSVLQSLKARARHAKKRGSGGLLPGAVNRGLLKSRTLNRHLGSTNRRKKAARTKRKRRRVLVPGRMHRITLGVGRTWCPGGAPARRVSKDAAGRAATDGRSSYSVAFRTSSAGVRPLHLGRILQTTGWSMLFR